MTKITLSAIVTAMMLLGSANAMADLNSQSLNNMHSLSKRPYQQLPSESAYQADAKWVGAGITGAELERNDKHLRFHMLGKRPFMQASNTN